MNGEQTPNPVVGWWRRNAGTLIAVSAVVWVVLMWRGVWAA